MNEKQCCNTQVDLPKHPSHKAELPNLNRISG